MDNIISFQDRKTAKKNELDRMLSEQERALEKQASLLKDMEDALDRGEPFSEEQVVAAIENMFNLNESAIKINNATGVLYGKANTAVPLFEINDAFNC